MDITSVSRLAAIADQRGNAIDKGAVLLRYIKDGRNMEETRRFLLDGKIRVTVRDVVAGTETDTVFDDLAEPPEV